MAVIGRFVDMAATIRRNGIAEVLAAVERGAISVRAAAAVAELPEDRQRKIASSWAAQNGESTSRQNHVTQKTESRPLRHVEIIEQAFENIRTEILNLKRHEGWADTAERRAAVKEFMKLYRRLGNGFEKYTTVGAEPNKTLFEPDADIPEHLQTQEFLAAWNSWWAHRKTRRLSVTDTVKHRQLKLLALGDSEQATAIVSKAEENKWQGIPDAVWIPKHDGLWCGREPAHADRELLKKIRATNARPSSCMTADERGREQAKQRTRFVDED